MLRDHTQAQSSTSASPQNLNGKQKELLISLAGEISSHINISDLAKCLGISLDDAKFNTSDTKRDKIFMLFMLWQSANSAGDSMAKLLTHLREQLKDASVDNIIKKYESQLVCESSTASASEGIALQCSDAPNDGNIDISDQTQSEDSERTELFPSGVCASVEEATGLSGGVSQQLICGQRTDLLTMRSKPETFAKVEVTRKIENKEKEFSILQCDIRKYLQANCSEDDIQDMKVYLTSLSVSIKEDTSPSVFTSHQAEIIVYNTLPQIFQWLTLNGCWSFLNFYLLASLVDRYVPDDALKKRVAKFKEDMEIFKQEMKLADFLPAWSGRCPLLPASGFEPIILRVNKDWADCTLAHVAEMEGFLESRFLINRFILRFANGRYGSVVIMWLVPSHVIAYLKEKIMAIGTKSLSEVGIVEMAFSDNLTVKASSLEIQPKPCTPTTSQALENGVEGFKTLLDFGNFDELYETSIRNPEYFWGTLAKQFLKWDKAFEKVMDCNTEKGQIKWFTKGKLNISVNCVDRHAIKHPNRVALIWEKDKPGETEQVTYKELLEKVCQIANVLKSKGVEKGDTIAIYMPICPLAVASMLACARIGAIHSVLFSKFAWVKDGQRTQLLKERISEAKIIITANTSPLSGRDLPLKQSLEVILDSPDSKIQHVLVYKRTDAVVPMEPGRDEWLEEAMEKQPKECVPESMDSEDDLFVMFTSGVTGSPKGVIHSQAGYLLHVAVTHKYYFDYQPDEIFACTADIGWITGHSYVVYGPLCNGATTVLFDNTATYPSASRYWELITKLGINHFYTTPSVIRKLMSQDKELQFESLCDLPSLRIIASVGECLSRDAWEWFHKNFGDNRCHLIDTWWQTELGGIAIAPPPKLNLEQLKPGFIMKPSFGVVPRLIDDNKEQVTGELYLEAPLPGMGRRLTGVRGQEMFGKEYFKDKHGKVLYYTSDIVHKDEDGDYQVYGRVNDAIRYRGELLNLPNIEGAANASHESIEKTVLVMPHNSETPEEPEIVAHVKLKDKLTPREGEDVTLKVKASIEKTSQIKKNKLKVELYEYKEEEENTLYSRETFSGKLIRQSLRSNFKELNSLNQDHPFSIPTDPWRLNGQDNSIVAQ